MPKMTPEEKREYLEKISFRNLVKEIDKKWGSTYQDYDPEDDSSFNIGDLFSDLKNREN